MLPIRYHFPPELEPDTPTRFQLENAAAIPDAFHHVAVLPDVHAKFGRKCPTGTVLAAESIYPQIMDTAPNCGMRLIGTPWKEEDLNKKSIRTLFQALVNTVPTRTYVGNYVPYRTVLEICRQGSAALAEYLGEKNGDEQMMFNGGTLFDVVPDADEITNAIPSLFLRLAQGRLGILGEAGNHFLDLMKIEAILDETKAEKLNIAKGQYVFLLHTGSGILGQYASYFFTPKREEHLSMKIITNLGRITFGSQIVSRAEIRKLQKHVRRYREKKEYFRIDAQTPVGRAYLTAHRASGNYGFANRSMIAANIKKTIKETLGEDAALRTICDIPHIFVNQENHYGKDVWVHRNGASRGFGPSRLKGHRVFGVTGEPGILAGSMNTPSYLVCGTDKNESTFFSINHGAGKTKHVSEAAPHTKTELMKNMKESRVPLFNARSQGVIKQASQYYKDIDQILGAVKENSIADPVAKLTPVAVLMA